MNFCRYDVNKPCENHGISDSTCTDCILEKIRAEIEEHAKINQNLNIDRARALCWCLNIIDKYKEESEKKE